MTPTRAARRTTGATSPITTPSARRACLGSISAWRTTPSITSRPTTSRPYRRTSSSAPWRRWSRLVSPWSGDWTRWPRPPDVSLPGTRTESTTLGGNCRFSLNLYGASCRQDAGVRRKICIVGLKDRILRAVPAVALIVGAAVAADYILNVLIRGVPSDFTPFATAIIALVVATPLALWLTSQRLRLDELHHALSASLESKQKAIEEAEEALAKYREADRLYRLLGDNLTDHVALWSRKGERLYSSHSIERITGYGVEEFLSLPPTAMVSEPDFRRAEKVIMSLSPGGPPASLDYECIRKDGSIIWLESSYSRLGDGSGILL